MATQTLSTATSGLLFGAALSAAGVASPSVIISQLRLENFHMLEVFLAATASSALVIHLSKRASLAPCPPRKPSSYGHFLYDGNIAGGLLLGAGMALTGSCPGTVFVQLGMGLRSALYVLAGSLLGGVLFVGYAGNLRRALPAAAGEKGKESALTIPQRFGIPDLPAVVAFQAVCLSAAGAARRYLPGEEGALGNPIVGGVLMGASQLASLALTSNTLGVSSAFETFGKFFWGAISGPKAASWPAVSSLVFAAGVAGGSAVFWRLTGTLPDDHGVVVGSVEAVVGGVLMAFGSRVAGGCTSGHGISGLAGLSVASLVTVVAMFGGGIVVALGLKAVGF